MSNEKRNAEFRSAKATRDAFVAASKLRCLEEIRPLCRSVVNPPSINQVMDLVASEFNLPIIALSAPFGNAILTPARQLAMALVYKHCKKSSTQIGKLFNRNHSQVIRAYQKLLGYQNRQQSGGPGETLLRFVPRPSVPPVQKAVA